MTYETPPHGFRTFFILWFSQSISVFGSALTLFALNIWLTQVLYPRPEQKPQLAFALAAVNIAYALPVVFITPLAGAWADRHNRKGTMAVSDFLDGLLSLTLAGLIFTRVMQLWMLLPLTVVAAILSAFHFASFDASYSMIVPEKHLPRANGMMQTIWSLSGIISPGLAAGLISLPALARQGLVPGPVGESISRLVDGTPLAITIDAVTFFGAAATLFFLSIPSPMRTDLHTNDGARRSIWADVLEGARYIWNRRPLLWLLGTFTVANFAGAPFGVLQPLVVKFNLAQDWAARGFTFETALALLASIGSLGGVVGGVLVSTTGGLRRRRVYGVVVAILISGTALTVFGLSPFLYLSAAMAFTTGIMFPIMNSHSQAIWQGQTPRELQGRVFSVRRLIAQFSWPLGTAFAGWAGGAFNPGLVISACGAAMALFCIAQLFNPALLRIEDKAWLDQMAEDRQKPAVLPSSRV